MRPIRPHRSHPDLLPISGRLGPEPEHFVVEEIPAYLPQGEGEHLFLWVEKRLQNTAQVAKFLADHFRVPAREVGYAGMKDRVAVTRQWFSLLSKTDPEAPQELGEGIRLLAASRHKNKLRTGHLHGNRFELSLVDCDEHALGLAEKIVARLSQVGLRNYYGAQRFGRDGKNLEQALKWLRAPEEQRRRRSRQGPDPKLLISSLQSEHFNRYVSARLGMDAPLLTGEVVRLSGTNSHFVVEDVAAELPRFQAGDLLRTGPIWGGKTLKAASEALALEEQVWQEMGLSAEDAEALRDEAPGARRDLLMIPEGLSCQQENELLRLRFQLPAGSFATQVLREFLPEQVEDNSGEEAEPQGDPA